MPAWKSRPSRRGNMGVNAYDVGRKAWLPPDLARDEPRLKAWAERRAAVSSMYNRTNSCLHFIRCMFDGPLSRAARV